MDLLSLHLRQTQRIVFLIDLQPIADLQNSDLYASAILKSAAQFLNHPPLSDSLFAFRLFFSSLHPILPTTELERHLGSSLSPKISFDRPANIAQSLKFALRSVKSAPTTSSNAVFVAGSLQQLLLDYVWEPADSDLQGMLETGQPCFAFPPNLIILFSAFPRCRKLGSLYLGFENEGDSGNFDRLRNKFVEVFGNVAEKFRAVNANVCCVDVGLGEDKNTRVRDRGKMGFLEHGIRRLGWGFVSCDAIVLGSLVVPFGLIWPVVASPIGLDSPHSSVAEMNLEIVDVKGKPLNCKLCDLEVVRLKPFDYHVDLSLVEPLREPEIEKHEMQELWERFGSTGVMFRVNEVRPRDQLAMMRERVRKHVLLRGYSGKVEDKRKISDEKLTLRESIADTVLQKLRWKETEFTAGNPAWQILVTFLYMQSSIAIVSIFYENECCFTGLLEPFTVHTAILGIVNDGMTMYGSSQDYFDRNFLDSGKLVLKDAWIGSGTSPTDHSGPSFTNKGNGSSQRGKPKDCSLTAAFDLTWDELYASVLSNSSEAEHDEVPFMDLQLIYFCSRNNIPKRLAFLKCWMKQIMKRKNCRDDGSDKAEPKLDAEDKMEDVLLSSQQSLQSVTSFIQESPQDSSHCLPVGEDANVGVNHDPPDSCHDSPDSFYSSVRQKIGHALHNIEVDLASLAERLVELCMKWLQAKHDGFDTVGKGTLSNCSSQGSQSTYSPLLATNVASILLRKPKELAAKYKGFLVSSMTEPANSDMNSDPLIASSPEVKVREHELQVLFRMEILKATTRAGVKDEIVDKWVKEICSMLHNIEFDLQGGIFGGTTLLEFTERVIKSRYSNFLEDTILKIYTEMEFLSFDTVASGSDECDSNQDYEIADPRIEIPHHGGQKIVALCKAHTSFPLWLEEETTLAERHRSDAFENKLKKAVKNREQARKRSFFTMRLPDLQRVWAPKHLGKLSSKVNVKHERKKQPKRITDIVYETPPLLTKRNRRIHERGLENGTNPSSRPVTKVLFPKEGKYKLHEVGCGECRAIHPEDGGYRKTKDST